MEILSDLANVLESLSDESRMAVLPFIQQEEIEKNQYLVSFDSVCRHLYFIQKGVFRTYLINENGKEVNLEFSMEGRFITSIISFYKSEPSTIAIQSLENAIVYKISHNDLEYLYDKYPELNKLGRLLTEENFMRREEWHTEKYSNTATKRYELLMDKYPGLSQRVPLQHLASYLGISKEHLSRIRAS